LQYTDDAVGAADRAGKYWFVEGLVNASPRIYLASRYSTVSLDGGMTAKLGKSPVAVNEYNRWSIGAGYRLTPLAHLKLEYSRNMTSGGASEPDLDQISLGLATKF
jgi:predicted porin